MSALRFKSTSLLLIVLLLLAPASPAPAKGVRGVAPDGSSGWLHTVEKGDTLWDITEMYLGSPWIWPSVWKDNDTITDPDVISPGDRIWITEKGIRKLSDEEIAKIAFDPPSDDVPAAPLESLTRQAVPARPTPSGDPFAALDRAGSEVQRIVNFPGLHRFGFLTPTELEGTAAILGSHDENYWTSQERKTIIGIGEGKVHIGDQFTIFRTRRRVDHPQTRATIGYLIDRLGTAEVIEIHEESSFVRVLSAYSEIEPGDRVTPYGPEATEFVSARADKKRDGVVAGMPIHRQFALGGDVVVIDLGTNDGVAVGHEFEVFRAGKEVRDPVTTTKTLVPDDIVGSLMVLKTSTTSSLALLTRADRPIKVGDHFRGL